LRENLISEGYAFALGGRITQDALENIFSQIRRKAGRKPNAIQCLRAIRLISISHFFSEIKSKIPEFRSMVVNHLSEDYLNLWDLGKVF
jgi:hypothetical protein